MTARLPTTIALVLLTCTGCTSSYSITFELPPGHLARVEATGNSPFLLVENKGPGDAEVTFISGGAPTGPARRIAPGTATGRTVSTAKRVEVASGPDEGTVVEVEALRATGLRLDAPAAEPDGDAAGDGGVVARDPGAVGLARGYTIPVVDLDADASRQVVVDREDGQYLGHPTTVLLEDGLTMLCVYPKGHGRGAIVYKRSDDAGLTWSDRLPVPESWSTSREVPTIHRVIDPKTGAKRLIMWSGLYPARLAVSEDDGATWSPLRKVGDWGGIVVMGCLERLADGSYVALFHDDGRFFTENGERQSPVVFTLYQTFSHDGGLTWSPPEAIWSGTDLHLCEPGIFRSPDGETLALLLRENSRRRNSYVMFSKNEAKTWSEPRELPAALTGDRHTGRYAPDGRLFISFRDTTHESPTKGDWVGWVGTWEDIVEGREGQYRVRLKDNKVRGDCAYPGVEVLSDGTYVVTTYGHWDEGGEPYILSVRFTLAELDELRSGS